MVAAISAARNTVLPATSTSTPAPAMRPAFSSVTPPSISTRQESPRRTTSFFASSALASVRSINFCPPKPGYTLITRNISHSSSAGAAAEKGVSGLMTAPHFTPAARMALSVCARFSPHASACTVMYPAPASAKSAILAAGFTTMRCTSSGSDVCRLTAATICEPKVMRGTNEPSMMSQWIMSAPHFSSFSTAAPTAAKSADRIDGAILILFSITQKSA